MTVFSILGIIVLCIVGVLIIFLLLALFYPVRYKLKAKGKNEEMQGQGKMWWLFGLLSLILLFDKNELSYKLKLCGIVLKEGQINDPAGQVRREWDSLDEEEPEPARKEEEGFPSKVRAFFRKVKAGYEKASRIKRILGTRTGTRALRSAKRYIGDLLRLVKPDRIKGQIAYGFSDAATTGILYGFFAHVAYEVAGEELVVLPDFTETGIDADVEGAGKMQAGAVMKQIFRLMGDEDIQRTFRAIKRIIRQ